MRTCHLNALLIVAILAISTSPLDAQDQQPDVAKLKADAQKFVSIISGDEAAKMTEAEEKEFRIRLWLIYVFGWKL